MSTKIHNGYRIAHDNLGEPWSLGDVFNMASAWYELWALPILRREVARQKVILACQFIDAVYSGVVEAPRLPSGKKVRGSESPLMAASMDMNDRLVDGHGKRGRDIPEIYEMDVSIQLGFTQLANGEILIYVIFPDFSTQEIEKSLSDQHWIEYFGYWNNTDQPEDVSDEEWEYRRKCWKEALPGPLGIPANHMLFYTPTVAKDCQLRAEPEEFTRYVEEEVPFKGERARRIAENLAVRDRAAATGAQEPHEFMRAFSWAKEEGRDYVESIKQEILPRLPHIDAELLKTTFEELREVDRFDVLDFHEQGGVEDPA